MLIFLGGMTRMPPPLIGVPAAAKVQEMEKN
jgi:hypothetical protein